MNIGVYGEHTDASILKLANGAFGEQHYPFALEHRGLFIEGFNNIMIGKNYRNGGMREAIRKVLKSLLGQSLYLYLKITIKKCQ